MKKSEITQEEKTFKLDPFTLNKELTYWIVKSNCMWTLKTANKKYDELREMDLRHPDALDGIKRQMFVDGKKLGFEFKSAKK